jgi:hypothetical protein
MSVEEYLRFDVSDASDFRRRLLGQIDDECESNALYISGEDDPVGVNLTSAMKDWVLSNIANRRGPAIQEITQRFAIERVGRINGFLLEARVDEIERGKYAAIKTQTGAFYSSGQIQALMRELEEARNRYEAMQAEEGGREPTIRNWYYSSGIMLFVLLSEALINFQSFMSLGLFEYMAFGLTMLVAGMIAFAAHNHGTTIKQWKATFGGGVDDTHRRTAAFIFNLASAGVAIALGVVAWGRYSLITPIIEREILSGENASFWTYFWQLGASLGGNVIVYVIGVLLAYFAHDRRPGFAELKVKMDDLQSQFDSARSKILSSRIQKEIFRANQEIVIARQSEGALRQSKGYQENRNLFEKIRGKDSQILGLLNEYRRTLLATAKKRGIELRCSMEDFSGETGAASKTLSTTEYQGLIIKLRYDVA